jgi:hypothetical protein
MFGLLGIMVDMTEIALCDTEAPGFGWIEAGGIRRCAHALAREGQVWLVDPYAWDGLDDELRALGEPAGVIQLLDRHGRDCAALAARFGVPHHEVPAGPIPDSPFVAVPLVSRRFWRESALWWADARVLVCADALGTVSYFRARSEPVGVHPFLRLRPPRELAAYAPRHLLVGHGEGLHGDDVPDALAVALHTARRRLPSALLNGLRRA